MSERHVVGHLPAYWSGNLDVAAAREVKDHLGSCSECRKESETVKTLWDALGRIPDELPSASLAPRFQGMLRAYEEGLQYAAGAERVLPAVRFIDRLLNGRPAFQAGVAVALIAMGIFAGVKLDGSSRTSGDVAQLREEVRGLSNLLAVSLLQQESASERLKGVSWSSRLAGEDPDIRSALLQTMRHDPNVNVRLAALDALARDLGTPAVRHELVRAFPGQKSPLVQLALVDLMIQMNDPASREALQEAMRKTDLHPDVRKRIKQGIQMIL